MQNFLNFGLKYLNNIKNLTTYYKKSYNQMIATD